MKKLVMPAIYRLEFPEIPYAPANEWGWHFATDLVEAVNNLRSLAELELDRISPIDMGREYGVADPMSYSNYFLVAKSEHGVFKLDPWSPRRGKWLHQGVEQELYFPAKIGMLLIDAVRHPLKARAVAVKRHFVAVG